MAYATFGRRNYHDISKKQSQLGDLRLSTAPQGPTIANGSDYYPFVWADPTRFPIQFQWTNDFSMSLHPKALPNLYPRPSNIQGSIPSQGPILWGFLYPRIQTGLPAPTSRFLVTILGKLGRSSAHFIGFDNTIIAIWNLF